MPPRSTHVTWAYTDCPGVDGNVFVEFDGTIFRVVTDSRLGVVSMGAADRKVRVAIHETYLSDVVFTREVGNSLIDDDRLKEFIEEALGFFGRIGAM